MSQFASQPNSLVSHRSPSITAIFNELKSSRTHHILDLGESSGSSFAFFSQLSCNIHFESLGEVIQNDLGSVDEQILALKEYLTVFSDTQKFDVILAWDFFNYLHLETIQWLMKHLEPHCNKNAVVHFFKIVGQTIPQQPRCFHIKSQYEIHVQHCSKLVNRHRPCPSTTDLIKLFPNYKLENSYLNHAGMIPNLAEQLMRFSAERSLSRKKQLNDELTISSSVLQTSGASCTALSHQSHALESVFRQIQGSQQNGKSGVNILDLGVKNRGSLDFLYAITDGLYTENLFQEYSLQKKTSSLAAGIKSHMLNFPDGIKFDVILTWDIFNYLPFEWVSELSERLTPHLHNQTLLHTIIYSGKEIPSEPQRFQLTAASQLNVITNKRTPNTAPLNSTRLSKGLANFRLTSTHVYQPGMQRGIYEYIFTRTC